MPRKKRETALPDLILAAREMRREFTHAEEVLWKALRLKQLGGARFRRQHVVGPYILDYYCMAKKLAVEVDGKEHSESDQKQYDQERTSYLNTKGIMVLRFLNDQVENDLDGVLSTIFEVLSNRS
jgi:very-short-patch-repair endonuclease